MEFLGVSFRRAFDQNALYGVDSAEADAVGARVELGLQAL